MKRITYVMQALAGLLMAASVGGVIWAVDQNRPNLAILSFVSLLVNFGIWEVQKVLRS